MTTEENNRMLALSCIVADLKAENMELLERMQNISAEFADVLCRLNEKEKRKNEDSSNPPPGEVLNVRAHCYKLEVENRELKHFVKVMHEFVKDKNIFMKKDMECPFRPGCVPVCSTHCLECDSCLGVIEGVGVICEKRLAEANVSFLVCE